MDSGKPPVARPSPLPFPPLCPRAIVQERLKLIFPDGTPNRQYCVRDIAAATVFTMLYIGAVEGSNRFWRRSRSTG